MFNLPIDTPPAGPKPGDRWRTPEGLFEIDASGNVVGRAPGGEFILRASYDPSEPLVPFEVTHRDQDGPFDAVADPELTAALKESEEPTP